MTNALCEIDWTAASTIVLTMITAYYAVSTRQILKATVRQAQVAEENLRILLADRRERAQLISEPIQRIAASGKALVDVWTRALETPRKLGNLPRLEPDHFFETVELARGVAFALYDELVAIQQSIVSARVKLDSVRAAYRDPSAPAADLRSSLQDLRAQWTRVEERLKAPQQATA